MTHAQCGYDIRSCYGHVSLKRALISVGEIRILGRRRRLGDNIKMDYIYKPVTVKWLRVE